MNDHAIEQEIQAKGLTAPRITPADIEANIASEHYFTAANGNYGAQCERVLDNGGVIDADAAAVPPPALSLLTFCVLILRNGFTVTGESACASPENFNAEIGRKIARQKAIEKVWPLMGYELCTKLAEVELRDSLIATANNVQDRIRRINQGDTSAAFTDDVLIYAATTRCECGAGMAYPTSIGPHGAWHCSDILTFRAATSASPEAKTHTNPLPFSFYSIKSENQPSAHGATTRHKT